MILLARYISVLFSRPFRRERAHQQQEQTRGAPARQTVFITQYLRERERARQCRDTSEVHTIGSTYTSVPHPYIDTRSSEPPK